MELFGYIFDHGEALQCSDRTRWLHESIGLFNDSFRKQMTLDCLSCTLNALIAYIDALKLLRDGGMFLHLLVIVGIFELFLWGWMTHMLVFFVRDILSSLLIIVALPIELVRTTLSLCEGFLRLCKLILDYCTKFLLFLQLCLDALRGGGLAGSLIPRPKPRRPSPVVQLYNPGDVPTCPVCRESYASLEWNLCCFTRCGHTFCATCAAGPSCHICSQAGETRKLFLRQ
jgi:hypothetical protein